MTNTKTTNVLPARRLAVLGVVLMAIIVADEMSSAAPAASARVDVIEFLSGAKVRGKVISKSDTHVTVKVVISGRSLTRKYPLSRIHAVMIGEKRYELNAKTGGGSAKKTKIKPSEKQLGKKTPSDTKRPAGVASTGSDARRTRSQLEAYIGQMGRTPPSWYSSTALKFPQTLDLSWPEPPPTKDWNSQKNVGQFVWSVINENPGRWREGVRFMHHMLALHKNNPKVRQRAMRSLGGMYFRFFQDYARAAFWWKQAGVRSQDQVRLAECYWRLGNKQMAVNFLTTTRIYSLGMIKLWADMGETNKAVQVARAFLKNKMQPHMALLYTGDAYRLAGQFRTALGAYQQCLNTPPGKNAKQADNVKKRARASIEAIKLFELSDVSKVADGTYQAQSPGYNGPVAVDVTVAAGKIESVKVTRHTEKQFYSALTDTPRQIIAKQGVKGVDATSGATITAEAIINATAKALASGAGK